jgi:hypothetical protein
LCHYIVDKKRKVHKLKDTMNHTGKAAVFVRGFMTKFAELQEQGKPIPLRICQNAGLTAVQELSENISVAYISKLARELSDDGVVAKTKQGRKYFMKATDKTELFLDWLDDNPHWGVDLHADDTLAVQDKMEIVSYMRQHKGVLISAADPLPKSQYSYLMKKFQEGRLNMVFVLDDQDVYLAPEGDTPVDEDLLPVTDFATGMSLD